MASSFKILGIEHVAIAVNESRTLAEFFNETLHIPAGGKEVIADQGVSTDIYDTGGGKVELLEPVIPDSPISKFLSKRGEGIHHIAFRVDDIHAAIEELIAQGVQMIDTSPRTGAEGLLIAFVHPASTPGVLVELCQEPEGVNRK